MQRTWVKPFVEQVNRLTIWPIYPVIPTALFPYGILSWKIRLPLETVSIRYLRLLYSTSANIGIRIEVKFNGFCHHGYIDFVGANKKKRNWSLNLFWAFDRCTIITTMYVPLRNLDWFQLIKHLRALCASAVVHYINCRDPIHPARHFAPFWRHFSFY